MESRGTEQSLSVSDGGCSDHGEVGGLLLSVRMVQGKTLSVRCGT